VSAPQFTPGPWALQYHGELNGGAIKMLWTANQRVSLCVENEADAKLIAASPELFEALDEYMKCVAVASDPAMRQADVITLAEVQDRMVAARDAAEAALAKARGDQ